MAEAEVKLYRAESLQEFPWIEHGFGTRLAPRWLDPTTTATVRQIHCDRVLQAAQAGLAGEADALITNTPGLMLAIRTADCLPILMADPKNRAVAAIHAGWRGTVLEIGVKTVRAMMDRFGTRPEDLLVVVGPGIGQCCFEVGPEVASQFTERFTTHIDLAGTNLRQLGQLGIPPSHLVSLGVCTCCNPDTFHSYRRDREAAGRMVSAIRILG